MVTQQRFMSFTIPLMLTLGIWFFADPRLDFAECFIVLACFAVWALYYTVYAVYFKPNATLVWWGIGYGVALGVGCRLVYLMYLIGMHS